MKCQILFAKRNKKNIIRLSSAEFAHSMVGVSVSPERCPRTLGGSRISSYELVDPPR